MSATNLAHHLTGFLTSYLPAQRGASQSTVRSYRDTFVLLLRYCRDHHDLKPEKMRLSDLPESRILEFLMHLEQERGSNIRTRNQRLAALHAFFRYVQAEEPGALLQCQKILAIPLKRHPDPGVKALTPEETRTILAQPDRNTRSGRRDAAMLSLLYDTGARVQELVDVRVRDLRLDAPAQVTLTGKGRKTRVIPLMAPTVALLKDYLEEHRLDRPEAAARTAFGHSNGTPLTRSGVRHVLNRHVQAARDKGNKLPEKISPHTLRHSKAMHLLQAGVPLVIIANILGHVDVKTTEVYAKADMEMKRKALEKVNPSPTPSTVEAPSWQTDKALLEWLKGL